MENSITGFPYHESQHRARMRRILGPQKYEFFFDKWLEYFFTEKDAKFLASLGLNCLRLPFNYHIFEDDMNPRVLVESGFKHLDRVVNLVSIVLSPVLLKVTSFFINGRNSALNMVFTPSWICTPCPAVIIQPDMPPFGITRIIRTVQFGSGSRLPCDTSRTPGLLGTNPSMSPVIQSTSVS